MQQLYVGLRDISCLNSLSHYVLIVGKSYQLYAGILERLLCNGESVSVRCNHTYHLDACLAQSLNSLQAASACRYKVFNDNHLCAFGQLTLNEVAHAVVFSLAADINERQTESIGHERSLSYGSCGNAGNGISLREMLKHCMHKLELHIAAQVRIRQGLAVIAIEGRLPSRSPCERIVWLKLYSLYLQQL